MSDYVHCCVEWRQQHGIPLSHFSLPIFLLSRLFSQHFFFHSFMLLCLPLRHLLPLTIYFFYLLCHLFFRLAKFCSAMTLFYNKSFFASSHLPTSALPLASPLFHFFSPQLHFYSRCSISFRYSTFLFRCYTFFNLYSTFLSATPPFFALYSTFFSFPFFLSFTPLSCPLFHFL